VSPFAASFPVVEASARSTETLYRQGKHLEGPFVTEDEADPAWLEAGLWTEGLDPHLDELGSPGVVSPA
jgi:hypothetical protein